MKILFVTDFYHPYSGGVEIHVRTVASELARRGHEVAVATMRTPKGQAERTEDGPIRVFPVGHTAERSGVGFTHEHRPWAPPFPDPVAMLDLRAVVADYQPDVIHGHDWLARSALPRMVSGRTPIVTSLHYYTRSCAKKTLWRDGAACEGPSLKRCLPCAGAHYGRAKGTAVALGLRAGAALEDRRTSRWISVSAATAEGNGLGNAANAGVIANPLGPEPTDTFDATGTLSADVPDGPFILFVGDIRPEKGLRVLADAVAHLRTTGDETPLVVAGERMSGELDLPSGTIELGLVDHDLVQALWRRATVGAIPSLWPEPFGLVAIEAMAAGCPLVASDIGGLGEILADGRARLVTPGDHLGFAAAVAELLADPEARSAQAALASASVDRYTLGPIIDAIVAEYRAVLS